MERLGFFDADKRLTALPDVALNFLVGYAVTTF
jgi:hypothetical protein